jgi:hypothetical protein
MKNKNEVLILNGKNNVHMLSKKDNFSTTSLSYHKVGNPAFTGTMKLQPSLEIVGKSPNVD